MFNHEARWDRKLPQAPAQEAGSAIAVKCLFDKCKVIPQSFFWRNRELSIQKINFFWKDKQGKETLDFFSVSTSNGTFEIVFSHEAMSWRLNKLLGP
ncbi:MAG TPA: hypothetical protein DCL35_00175 [Candidatus Omnitrophica bacterium]|nr:hypothetical protein [Candidatus Omnitrophota bacterium]